MISLNDTIKVVLTWLLTGDDFAQNVFHFSIDGALPADDQAWLDLITAWVVAVFDTDDDVMSDECSLNEINISVLNQTTGEFDPAIQGVAGAFTGASTSTMLPHGTGPVLERFSTNPRSTGRCFLPGLPTGGQADGQISSGFLTSLLAVATRMATNYNGAGGAILVPRIFSRGTLATNAVTGAVRVSATPGYQRRRKPGVGL